MNNKLVYLIFSCSLIVFLLIYIFVPTIPIISTLQEDLSKEDLEEDVSTHGEIIGSEYVAENYKGEISLSRVWLKMKLNFIQFNKDIINSGLSFEEYFDNNTNYVEVLYGINNKDEFVKLMNSFSELGDEIYSARVISDTIELIDNGIRFNIIAINNNSMQNYQIMHRFYTCTIYNKEEKEDVIYKIEPYKYMNSDLEVE